ncbi:MAG: hypothetical protein COA78_02135 [Blastopirellula sp.]|nr:MAG: hypothetical protein COA78_02135 [Blastopirellula sp.]
MLIGLLIEALVLMALLKTFNDDDLGLGSAFALAIGTSIITALAMAGFVSLIGLPGIIVAAVLAALSLGIVISFFLGSDLKQACIIGGIFMVVHIVVAIIF